jgi:16S rRNA U1498 N3-methylase RsmE
VRPPVPLAAALDLPHAETRAWLADATGDRPSGTAEGGPWAGVVGPSSGFTADERDSMIARGFTLISLGARRLRTETAALALAVSWTTFVRRM